MSFRGAKHQTKVMKQFIMSLRYLFVFILFTCLSIHVIKGELVVPGLLQRPYQFSLVSEGDINIGLFANIHALDGNGKCRILNPSGVMWSLAMRFAVKQINERNDVLPNVTLGFVQMDMCNDPLKALEVSVYFVKDTDKSGRNNCGNCSNTSNSGYDVRFRSYDVIGIVGPRNSGQSVAVSPFLGTFDIPVLAISATANSLSDKTVYPYFLRLIPADLGFLNMLLQVMRTMNWTYVSMVYEPSAYGDGAASDLNNLLQTNSDYPICLAVSARIPPTAVDSDYDAIVDRLVSQPNARVVILYMVSTTQVPFFKSVRRRAGVGRFLYLGGDAFGGLESVNYIDLLEGSIYVNAPNPALPGFVQYVWSLTYGQELNDIQDEWFGELWKYQFPCISTSNNSCGPWQSLNQSSIPLSFDWAKISRVYDGVNVYAHAIHNAINETCPDAFIKSPQQSARLTQCLDGQKVLHFLKNTTIAGVIGTIRFDKNGDFIGAVEAYQYQSHYVNGVKSYVAVTVGRMTDDNTLFLDMNTLSWTSFNNATNSSAAVKPDSVCSLPCKVGEYAVQLQVTCCWTCEPCPPDGDLSHVTQTIRSSFCVPPMKQVSSIKWSAIIAGVVVTGVLIALMTTCGFIVRWKRTEAKIRQLSWKINYDDIDFFSGRTSRMISKISRSGNIGSSNTSLGSAMKLNNVCIYKDQLVTVTRVEKNQVNLTRQDLMELTSLKGSVHDNIQGFVGACIDPGHVCYLMQFCSRRTVQDIVADDSIKLDWLFRLSFVTDAVQGMKYLHKSVFQSHGHLTSAQCYVDSRWVLKIGGFSLHAFRDSNTDIDQIGVYTYHSDLLWTAPELLRFKERPINGTREGDVYSFAIIVQEITFRAQPYFCDLIEPKTIIERVRNREVPLFRPVLTFDEAEDIHGFDLIMQRCWAENPSDRPSFEDVAKMIKKFNIGKKVDIIDNMIQRLEKHADNLESQVKRRTVELEDEKFKTERLLSRMLPPFVAEELKAGRTVTPQMFESVTIYFSDIVGFTTLSSQSTPFEVIDLLNDLYICFDDIIGRYDVYKVETIGDAYMVVSGLPKPNEGRHIVEICNVALNLLDEVSRFKIRHRPEKKLKLRIGIHTGPCAAGVVGHAMPRYCLFGDTVNTASRMESTGEALKIHLSEDAQKSLNQFSGFHVEPRGKTSVKGKGVMTTYWLLSKTTSSTVPLADDNVAVNSGYDALSTKL